MISRVLIAGASGMLGSSLQRILGERGTDFAAPAEREFDITDPDAVGRVVADFAASIPGGTHGLLINAAAYTNVEAAEDNRDCAYRVNEYGARLLAGAARDSELGFVHVSTDFVFDGRSRQPYVEADEPNPLSVYGASKLAGERAVLDENDAALIVRTAWAFGANGVNFPTKILAAARQRDRLLVVNDEIGSPTYTVDLALGIVMLASAGATGLYHLTGAGQCSRYEFAREILGIAGVDTPVEPVASDAMPSRVARPRNSVLDCGRAAAVGVILPDWHDGLSRFLTEIGEIRMVRSDNESDIQ